MKYHKRFFKVLTAVNLSSLILGCSLACRGADNLELIRDGSFEDAPCGVNNGASCGYANISAGPQYTSIANLGLWHISTGGAVQVVHNRGAGQKPQDPSLGGDPTLYNTPDRFLSIYFGVEAATNTTAITSVSQDLSEKLQAGKKYSLTFLQSAYVPVNASLAAIPGRINVQVYVTGADPNATSIFNQTFTVNASQAGGAGHKWQTQTAEVDVPATTQGNYTISFSSLDVDPKLATTNNQTGRSVAHLDAVSLKPK